MLNGRAAALTRKDLNGFLEHTSSQVKEVEKPIAEAALRVPITGISLQLANSAAPGVTGAFKNAGVDLVYRFEGLPQDNVFRIQLRYEIATSRNGEWTVMNSRLGDPALPVWAAGPIETRRAGMFLALFRPGLGLVDKTLQVAQQARDELQAKVTHPLETGYLILLARSREEYLQMTANASLVSTIAQAETTYQVSSTSISVQSRFIVVNLDQLYANGSALETLQHELGHLALATETRPFTPAWVSESAAMYLAGTKPTSAWQTGVKRGTFNSISFTDLTTATSLGQHSSSADSASFEYAYSAAGAYYLIEMFGLQKYWQLYDAYAAVPASRVFERIPEAANSTQSRDALTGLGKEITVQTLQALYGLDLESLDRNVRDWITKQSRRR